MYMHTDTEQQHKSNFYNKSEGKNTKITLRRKYEDRKRNKIVLIKNRAKQRNNKRSLIWEWKEEDQKVDPEYSAKITTKTYLQTEMETILHWKKYDKAETTIQDE